MQKIFYVHEQVKNLSKIKNIYKGSFTRKYRVFYTGNIFKQQKYSNIASL